ncbi:MAG: hypothetical protein RR983_06870, partial [Massilia sp.]
MEGPRQRSYLDEVKSFGRNIFDEGYIEQGNELRERLRDPNTIRNYRKELRELEAAALEQMQGFNEQLESILASQQLQPVDLKNGSRGIASYFKKLQNGQLSDDIVNVTVEKCLEDESNWAAKSSRRYADILLLASSILMPLLQDAEEL